MTFVKAFIGHIIITIISFFILSYGYSIFSNDLGNLFYGIFHFCLVALLYVLSGYIITSTTKRFKILNYSAIALIGLTIWLICMNISPNDLNWKKGNGGVWLYHQLYFAGIEGPFWYNEQFYIGTNEKIKLQTTILLILSILPSILQAFGGILKMKRMKKIIETLPNIV